MDARLTDRLWPPLLALLMAAGCATTHTSRAGTPNAHVPLGIELAEVPFFSQEIDQCGPASLAAVLAWSGIPVRPADLAGRVYSLKRQGSLPTDMTGAARLSAVIQ
jgi:hypothetical protein